MAILDASRFTNSSRTEQMLMAKYDGLKGLDNAVKEALNRLSMSADVQHNLGRVSRGTLSLEAFDGWLEPLVRAGIQQTIDKLRQDTVDSARRAGAGSAATAVKRRTYKDRLGANINILDGKRIMPAGKRGEATGGKSGIRRKRSISPRTEQLRSYQGPDRAFILRFLEDGTDTRTAKPSGPTGKGSMATYGNRGSLTARHFFRQMGTDMEQAAEQLGHTLEGKVATWLEHELSGT